MRRLMFGSAVALVFATGVASAATYCNFKDGSVVEALWTNVADSASVQVKPTAGNDYLLYKMEGNGGNPNSYPNTANTTFTGDSLTIKSTTTLAFSNLGANWANFEGPRGLITESGATLRHWSATKNNTDTSTMTGTVLTVNGNLYVRATKEFPYVMHWDWCLPIEGNASAKMNVGGLYSTNRGTLDLRLCGDCSKFLGELKVDANKSSCTFNTPFGGSSIAVATPAGIAFAGTASSICRITFTGTDAGENTFLRVGAAKGLTVNGNLAMVGGSIYFDPVGSMDTLAMPRPLVVTGAFTSTAPLTLVVEKKAMSMATWHFTSNRIELIRAPRASAAGLEGKFSAIVANDNCSSYYDFDPGTITVETETDDTYFRVFGVVERPVVYQLETDSSSTNSVTKHAGSSLETGLGQYKWSDHRDQHAGAHYVVPGGKQLLVATGDNGSDTFLGDSLTVLRGGTLAVSGTFLVTNLTLRSGVTVASWGMPSVITGCVVRTEQADAEKASLITVRLNSNPTRNLHFANGLSGNVNMDIVDWTSTDQAKAPHYFYIDAPCPNYLGRCTTITPKLNQQVEANCREAVLSIKSADALGRPLNTSSYIEDTLVLSANQTLQVTEDTVFSNSTRQISVKMSDYGYSSSLGWYPPAKFDVVAGKTAVFRQPIKFYGQLSKTGGGTLALNGNVRTVGENYRHYGDNVLTVTEGAIKPLAMNCVTGLSVAFAASGVLALDVNPTDDNVGRYGLYCMPTRWVEEGQQPLVAPTDGKINVRFDVASGAAMPQTATVAVCTVPATSSVTEASFVSRTPGRVVTFTSATNDDGTRTISAYLEPAGLMLFMR